MESQCLMRLKALTYLKENERYTDCLSRYSEEGHCGG